MSDGYQRKHESGTEKRKKRLKKADEERRLSGSMLAFVQRSSTSIISNEEHSASQSVIPVIHDNIANATGDELVEISIANDNSISNDHLNSVITSTKHFESEQPFSSDPALWSIGPDLIEYFTKHPPSANINDLSKSRRVYGSQNRFANPDMFFHRLVNGEKIPREWLIYSPSTGLVFCYICKLFGSAGAVADDLCSTGLNDWKNAYTRIPSHERSDTHILAVKTAYEYSVSRRIDTNLAEQMKHEQLYWTDVLRRVVAVILFLGKNGLAFRGDNEIIGEKNNGNYLGSLELIAQFDPFLQEHLRRYGNKGKGSVSYLSATICDQFIQLLGEKVRLAIVEELKVAKYYSISVDSTPDVSHTDQLTVILRYVKPDGVPVERFFCFLDIVNHDGEYLFKKIMEVLDKYDINIMDCRGQCYDNASNMSGIYSGVQARLLAVNPLAVWIPCAAHSLNLVGVEAAKCCLLAVNFFGLLQCIYNLFSSSTKRWSKLLEHLPLGAYVVKNLSKTRWSANCDATKAVAQNYRPIMDALSQLSESPESPAENKVEAESLRKKLDTLEMALLCVVWNDILQTINRVNVALQQPGVHVGSIQHHYSAICSYLTSLRTETELEKFEEQAKQMVSNPRFVDQDRSRKRKRMFGENDTEILMTGKQRFRINTYLPILDKLLTEMSKRKAAYQKTEDLFGFLVTNDKEPTNIINAHQVDVEPELSQEWQLFRHYFSDSDTLVTNPPAIIKYIIEHKMINSFPNLYVTLRIYLCILATNCEGERSFSALTRVKSFLRSTMGQEKLTNLSSLAIESELASTLHFSDIISTFANNKARKVKTLVYKD